MKTYRFEINGTGGGSARHLGFPAVAFRVEKASKQKLTVEPGWLAGIRKRRTDAHLARNSSGLAKDVIVSHRYVVIGQNIYSPITLIGGPCGCLGFTR
jgi:hypothetical protein